jgi:hypothetical protein
MGPKQGARRKKDKNLRPVAQNDVGIAFVIIAECVIILKASLPFAMLKSMNARNA